MARRLLNIVKENGGHAPRARLMMELVELARKMRARVVTAGKSSQSEVSRVYAGDRMSDLLREASAVTLLVTHLATPVLVRAAALLDVPGLCLVNGIFPQPAMISAAGEHGIAVIVSTADMAETVRMARTCLCDEDKDDA